MTKTLHTNHLTIVETLAFVMIATVNCSALDVLVNQAGYERYAPKVFRVQRSSDHGGDGTFSVKRVSDQAIIQTGTLVRKGGLWNKWYWEGDFGPLAIDGDYYISATVGAETNTSYDFNVGVG